MSEKTMNRNLVVVGAILIQLCLGAIYAWSVFTPPLKASSAGEIAAIYGADQLELEASEFEALNAELAEPRAKLKEITARLRGVADPQELEELKAQQADNAQKVDGIVTNYVSASTLENLSYGLDNTRTQAVFSAGLAAFAIVMVIAGRLMPTLGPRKLAIAGGVVLGVGYILAGTVAGKNFPLLFFCVGIVGGAGIGLAYVVPIAVGMKWFPDKKGLITGLAVAGFGFGALIWVKMAGSWGHLIANLGLDTTFLIYGVVFMVACLIGSIWMVNPPPGYQPEGWTPPEPKAGSSIGSVDLPSGQMLRTPQFLMIFLCFVFGAGAGLMSIGLMKAFPMKAMMANGIDWAAASAAAGTAMAVCFSLANGIGRIAWGTISDFIGRKSSIILMMATQGIIVILFQWMAGTPGLLYIGATLIGFNFGGNFALFPTVTADTFGTKYLAQNYGWVFLAYGVGGIFGPMMGGRLGDLDNFPLAFSICGVLCLIAAGIISAVRPPHVEVESAVEEAAQSV
jgi:OFA family oxalate/formate antiporter-like MFS transporter